MFKTLKSCFFIVFFLLFFRYVTGVLISHTFPNRVWLDESSTFNLVEANLERNNPADFGIQKMWGRWDSPFYTSIAMNGYAKNVSTTGYSNLAFFPLYPILIYLFSLGSNLPFINFVVAILISNILFAISLWVLYKILREQLNLNSIQSTTVLMFLISFPGSYFYNLAFTESLFLFTTVCATYFLFDRKYLWASIFLSLVFVTRINGLTFLLPFIVYFIFKEKGRLTSIFFPITISLIPLGTFFTYMHFHSGSFFAPFIVQKAWNNYGFVPFGIFTNYFRNYGFTIRLEYIFSLVLLLFLFLLIIISMKLFKKNSFFPDLKLEIVYLILVFLQNYIIFTSVQNFNSIYRYASTLFPAFVFFTLIFREDSLKKIFPYVFFSFISFQTIFYTMFLVNVSVYGF